MPIPYEILIRGTTDGKLSGAHAIDLPGGSPRPLTKADLAQGAPDLNAAALARLVAVDAEIAAKEQEKSDAIQAARDKAADAEAALVAIEAAIADPNTDDSATLEIAKAEVERTKMTKRQKELAEIDSKIAELQARKTEIRAAKKA